MYDAPAFLIAFAVLTTPSPGVRMAQDEEASRPYTVVMEDGRESSADLVLIPTHLLSIFPKSHPNPTTAAYVWLEHTA